MGKPPKHETVKTLVVCWMGWAPSVLTGPNSQQTTKVMMVCGGLGGRYHSETIQTLVVSDGMAPQIRNHHNFGDLGSCKQPMF